MKKLMITAHSRLPGGRNGTLDANMADICYILGSPNYLPSGDGKVDTEWWFTDGIRVAGLWAYKQPGKWCTVWSVGGDISLVEDLFPGKVY